MARGKGKGKKTQELTEEQKQEIREAFDLFVRVINLNERSYILSNERVRRANLTDRSLDCGSCTPGALPPPPSAALCSAKGCDGY